ncbi:MAG: protein-L-isoaspartate(D-aspartate) O-methyltransferase [Deltaproteobacteria bacterium]|nr:MAG: protein-L-isoaspartate(D-aspartate) O-methyltransferase [Deltaproteobacteria bacterium]
MVAHLAARGVDDARVLNAMRAVPRHLFVPAALRAHAYDDRPLPIGAGQTISQPLVVALTAQLCALGPDDVALEVGAGSGYQAAVLAQLCRRVYALEIRPELAARARTNLLAAGVDNVVVGAGDGGHGWPEHAPYDAIAVAAAARTVPPPLVDQLADGGRLVIPLGAPDLQQLVRIVRRGDELERTEHGPVRFVAFVGDFG